MNDFFVKHFEIITSVLISALSFGMTYGTLLNRIKTLEREMENNKDTASRLASLEAKIDILLTLKNK